MLRGQAPTPCSQPHRYPPLPHPLLGLLHRVFTIVKDARRQHRIRAADAATWGAVVWQSVGNTMFGYAAWGWLLNRHPTATVAPMALMVPVFGLGASALLLGEPLQPWKLTAFALVMAGLSVGMLWPRIKQRLQI